MDAQRGRAKVPARITLQVSDDLKSKLIQLAQEEYGGNLQMLIRETLQVRVDRSGSETGLINEVLKGVKEIDRGMTRHHQDSQGKIRQLLEYASQLTESVNFQHTDIAEISDNWQDLRIGLANQNQLIGKLAAGVEGQNDTLPRLTEHIYNQNEAINRLVERAENESREKRRSFLRL